MSQQSVGLNIPSIQNKRPVTFAQNPTPAMQGGVQIDQEALRQNATETVNNNYLANRARASKETNPFALLGLGTALWYGIGQGMEKINKKFGGDWETSIGGKVANFGDRVSDTYAGKKTGAVLDWFSRQLDKLEKRSQIVYTLRHHHTSPEWSFAKVPAQGPLGYLGIDAQQLIEYYMEPIGTKTYKLGQYGMKPEEINTFVEGLKGKAPQLQKLEIQLKELELLGADSKVLEKAIFNRANIERLVADPKIVEQLAANPKVLYDAQALKAIVTKPEEYLPLLFESQRNMQRLTNHAQHMKAVEMGFKGYKDYKAFKILDNPEKVREIFQNGAKKGRKIIVWKGEGKPETNSFVKGAHKARAHLFGREVEFSQYANKYTMLLDGSKSRLGRAMSKALAWVTEGGSCRFGGGKLVVAMQASIFADLLLNVFNAPKGEKGKTFAERLVNDFTYFVAMTAGIWAMHKVGGFKFAGLKDNKDAIKAYDKALAKFNAKADAGLFKSKKAYNMAYKALDAKLGVKNIKNPITKLLHKIGKFVDIGNRRRHAYKSNAKYNLNWLRKIKNGNLLGVPMRILIPIAVVTPFLVKLTTTTAHKIFGRPTHSVLDEDQESDSQEAIESIHNLDSEKSKPQSQAAPLNPAQNPTNLGRQPEKYKNPQDYQSDTNLIKMTANNGFKPVNTEASQDTKPEPVRRYIPSPVGMVPKDPDTSAADKALLDADMAEKYVNETLMQLKQ